MNPSMSARNLSGSSTAYLSTTPRAQQMYRYVFQFHGSGIFSWKHFEKSSCTMSSVPWATVGRISPRLNGFGAVSFSSSLCSRFALILSCSSSVGSVIPSEANDADLSMFDACLVWLASVILL
jgi:hypothetical protein